MDEGEGFSVQAFPILGQPAAAVDARAMVRSAPDPIRGPALGQHDEALGLSGAFDDFDVELGDGLRRAAPEDIPAVAAVGIELEQKRVEAEQRRHHQHTAIAVPGLRRGRLWMPA